MNWNKKQVITYVFLLGGGFFACVTPKASAHMSKIAQGMKIDTGGLVFPKVDTTKIK